MKLNNKQSFAILAVLREYNLITDWPFSYNLISISALFDDEDREVRIISKYGMAGKLWNNNDKIYISGHNQNEASEEQYNKEQKEIAEVNQRIQSIIDFYKD